MATKPKAKAEQSPLPESFGLGGKRHTEHATRILDALHALNVAIDETSKDGTLVAIKVVMASNSIQLKCKIYCLTNQTEIFEAKLAD